MDKNIKTWPACSFSHQRKHQYGEGVVWLANGVAVWRQSEVSVDFQKVIGHEIFQPGVCLTNQKPHAFVSVR